MNKKKFSLGELVTEMFMVCLVLQHASCKLYTLQFNQRKKNEEKSEYSSLFTIKCVLILMRAFCDLCVSVRRLFSLESAVAYDLRR